MGFFQEEVCTHFIGLVLGLHLTKLLFFHWAGGVLVCATNSLLYLNQSVPPYGVSLNSIAEHSTDFPLSKYKLFLFKHKCYTFNIEFFSNVFGQATFFLLITPLRNINFN